MKSEENMKWEKKNLNTFLFWQKIHNKFKQHPINIKKLYSTPPHNMVHVPAMFRENTALQCEN